MTPRRWLVAAALVVGTGGCGGGDNGAATTAGLTSPTAVPPATTEVTSASTAVASSAVAATATTVASAAPGLDALLVQPAALPRPFTATVQPRPTVACGTTLKVVPLDGRAVGLDDGAGTTIGHVVNIHAGPPWPRPPTRNW